MEKMPVYVKIDEYKGVLNILGAVKDKIEQSKALLEKIKQIKSSEDAEMERWQNSLADVEGKVEAVDKMLLQPAE